MFENPVNLNQGAPEAIRIGWVVRAMSVVLAEEDSARYLRRQLGDFDRDLQVVQVPHDELVELGNAARLKRDALSRPSPVMILRRCELKSNSISKAPSA